MSKHTFIETAGRVFRVTLKHSKRLNRGRFYVSVESGPPMTAAEGRRIMAAVVAEMVGEGADVVWWRAK